MSQSFDIQYDVTGDPRPAVIVENIGSNCLNPQELALVSNVAGWRDQKTWLPLLNQVYGRSFILGNPYADPNSDLNNLQILGAGGSDSAVVSGVRTNKVWPIAPASPANGARSYNQVTQKKEFDPDGEIHVWHPWYVPTRGLTAQESLDREKKTQQMYQLVNSFEYDLSENFVLSQFVARGQLPDQLDPWGRPLEFHVYRVPGNPRAPQQLAQMMHHGAREALDYYINLNQAMANFLSLTHYWFDMAYVDCHIGNISMLSARRDVKLYLTDFESIVHLDESTGNAYRGHDSLVFLYSMHQSINNIHKWMEDNSGSPFSDSDLLAVKKAGLGTFLTIYTRECLRPSKELLNELVLSIEEEDFSPFVEIARLVGRSLQ